MSDVHFVQRNKESTWSRYLPFQPPRSACRSTLLRPQTYRKRKAVRPPGCRIICIKHQATAIEFHHQRGDGCRKRECTFVYWLIDAEGSERSKCEQKCQTQIPMREIRDGTRAWADETLEGLEKSKRKVSTRQESGPGCDPDLIFSLVRPVPLPGV